MNKINYILSGLPILIVLNWVVCLLFFKDHSFYTSHYFKLEIIDTIITALSLLHALFNFEHYSKISKNCIRAIIAIVLLTLIYPFINQDFYYFLYFFIIVETVLASINANLNEYNRK